MHRRGAYTLLEVSVLLVLLLILAAMLFPFFQARRVRGSDMCRSNLVRVALGFKQYAQDWDDRLPPVISGVAPGRKGNGWVREVELYYVDLKVLQCPSDGAWSRGNSSYAFNAGLKGLEEKKVRYLGSTVLLCEINATTGLAATASAPQVTDRHQGGANYAFEDGHIKWLASEEAPAPYSVPATAKNFTFGT